jgi:hypothetical protein
MLVRHPTLKRNAMIKQLGFSFFRLAQHDEYSPTRLLITGLF